MQTSSQDDALLEKRKKRTREKSAIVTAFLNEYGEHASWEEWSDFLHEQQVKVLNGYSPLIEVDVMGVVKRIFRSENV